MVIIMNPSFNISFGLRMLVSIVIIVSTAAASARGLAGERAQAGGATDSNQVVSAVRLKDLEIALDGRLDESAWNRTEAVHEFTQHEPDRGAAPSEKTMFMVAYDDHALYIGVACYETDAANINSVLCRRDQIDNSDYVSICMDPYHDKTTGYIFRVNPHGILADACIFDDGGQDWNWDAVWEAESSTDEHGWYIEMRIPFASTRYRPAESMTWGFQIYRYSHSRGELDSWISWNRETRGFVSRFGDLSGIMGIRPPRQLEIAPYFMASGTAPSVTEEGGSLEHFQSIGADIKYGVTADLTLNATLQPDFGQVEADPAVLSLSPFEVYYQEKRPFFVEGSSLFVHPRFNLFSSRRIGTGNRNSRVRFAGKLTGKVKGVTIAGLYATTDIAEDGKAYNIFKGGTNRTDYAVIRLGRETADGNHRFHLMHTAMVETGTTLRNAYTSGVDFATNFKDRMYSVNGSFVMSYVKTPATDGERPEDDAMEYGTGGTFDVGKGGGNFCGSLAFRWMTDNLDLNDLGYLQSNDDYTMNAWIQYKYDTDGRKDALITTGNINFNYAQSWLYAGRDVPDPDTPSLQLWGYGPGHRQSCSWNINGWTETRNFWSVYYTFWHQLEGSSKYQTRTYEGVRGPIMTTPEAYGCQLGINSDKRKPFSLNAEFRLAVSAARDASEIYTLGARWNQSEILYHRLSIDFRKTYQDAQWIDNFANPDGGIGNVSYVFGELNQTTWDLTLRSSLLFDRSKSLELYLQPFITAGSYANARELVEPDSYNFRPYGAEDFEVSDRDFRYGSVNLNMVFRWEYRSGSTFFLVWKHKRDDYTERDYFTDPASYDGSISVSPWFDGTPENTLMVKFSYLFSL